MKRLLFAYDPEPDESLIGAFAAACHEHRLRSLRSGIEGGGLTVPRPGNLQIACESTLNITATVMRTDPNLLRAAAFEARDARGELILADLVLPRQLFDLRRRWVAPRTLQTVGRHRADWLNRLLPYCPISLERLVGECSACGPLGWRTTRGIGACETCGGNIAPSIDPALTPGQAPCYRLAADLMSRNPETGAAAMARLPASLSGRTRTDVVQVMIRSGFLAAGHAAIDLRRATGSLSASEITAIVVDGARIISDWPKAIRQVAQRKANELGDDLVAYAGLRRDLRWLGNGSGGGAEIVSEAFPKMDGRSAEMFADETRYYTTTEANTKLWCKSSDLKRLRKARALDWQRLPSKQRLRIRYSAATIDALVDALDDCCSPSSAATSLDVPTYAVEQLVASTSLRVRDEPGVVALKGEQISRRSVEGLRREMTAAADQQLPPERLMPLRRVLAGYPGEKPWTGAVDLLLKGEVPFRMPDGPFSLRRLLVDPKALEANKMPPGERLHSLTLPRIALRDAYEILGARDEEAHHAMVSKGLEIIPDGKGKSVCRYALSTLCAEIAFTSEIAVFAGLDPDAVRHILKQMGIPKLHGAWSRDALLRHGLVRPAPDLPAAEAPRSVAQPRDCTQTSSQVGGEDQTQMDEA